jgi:cell division protein FtsL
MAQRHAVHQRKVQDRYNHRDSYVDGSAARKLHVVPDYEQEDDYDEEEYLREKQRQQRSYQERKRQERAKSRRKEQARTMDGISLILLTVAVLLTFYVCIQYLQVRLEITGLNKNIASMESQVATMKRDNNAALEEINQAFDLKYVYRVATQELGMVFPSKEQVINYDSRKSDYVKQFSDIPNNN